MDHCLFISDLHLCDSRPHITAAFIDFLENTAVKAHALYILGDLFEYWPGDDAMSVGLHKNIIDAFNNLRKKINGEDLPIYLMHGNRDFLLSDAFARTCNISILPDPSLITLYGKPVLLSHGDALCTDDIAYQQFRTEVRSASWQAAFLSQPLANRIAYIEHLRATSEQAKSTKSMQIMDANADAVAALFKKYAYPPLFIHGHTHRPNTHFYSIDGHNCARWVLGDWYEQGSYLIVDKSGCQSRTI